VQCLFIEPGDMPGNLNQETNFIVESIFIFLIQILIKSCYNYNKQGKKIISFWALACCDEFSDADHGYHNLAQDMGRIFCFCVEFLYIIPIFLSPLSI
jgi:hypothetical protein